MLAKAAGIGWQLSVDRKVIISSVMNREDGSYHLWRRCEGELIVNMGVW